MSRRPICLQCLKEYRVTSIGRMVVYKTRCDDGRTHDHSAIMADVLHCPGCEHKIVTSFAMKPLASKPEDVKAWADKAQSAIVVIV